MLLTYFLVIPCYVRTEWEVSKMRWMRPHLYFESRWKYSCHLPWHSSFSFGISTENLNVWHTFPARSVADTTSKNSELVKGSELDSSYLEDVPVWAHGEWQVSRRRFPAVSSSHRRVSAGTGAALGPKDVTVVLGSQETRNPSASTRRCLWSLEHILFL
jgi:hypothetical protein